MTDLSPVLNTALAGRYVIERELGRGGMATVYLGQDLKHHRPVAVKALHPELGAALGPERFLQEIRLTAQLQHPHILPVLDSGEADGLLWYTMPLVQGESLRQRLAREKQLPLEDALRIAREVAQALGYAHGQKIVHRDVKPENILLSSDGHALVADFGIAKAMDVAGGERLTGTGLSLGTPAYMSPEQATGERDLDGRSDIYSLGCVLYEMLAGEPPFTGRTAQAIIARRLSAPVPSVLHVRDAVPPAVDLIIRKMLSRVPADRFATAQQLRDALDFPDPAGRSVGFRPGWRSVRRHRILAGVIAVIALFGAAMAVYHARPLSPVREFLRGGSQVDENITSRQRIAVLPFQNLSGGAEVQYFAEGMSTEVTSRLSRIPGLRVVAHSAASRYAGSDLGEVGRALNVGSVLEGAVRREAGKVRVSLQLVDVRSRENLWAEEYDRDLRDVFSIQSEVAQQVAQALEVRLERGERSQLQRPPTSNPQAYDAYLRGLYYATSGPGLPEMEADSAVALFERAIELDPAFALAHAMLSEAYIDRVLVLDPKNPKWRERAWAEITKALALDSTAAEAYQARAELSWNTFFRADEPIRDLRRALRYQPNLQEAHEELADIYFHVGLLDEALAEVRMATSLDPTRGSASSLIGPIHFYQQKYDSALVELEEVPLRALALRRLGRMKEALALVDSALRIEPAGPSLAAAHAVLLASTGRSQKAKAQIALAISTGRDLPHFHHAEYWIGVAYVLMGSHREALQWLEAAARDGFPCYPLYADNPDLTPLRQDPHFSSLLTGLKTQWQRYRAIS